MDKEPSIITISVSLEFYKMIKKFIDEWEKENGIKISIPNATKIIYNKIQRKGGLTIE